jgi:hypothetical protein
MEKKKDYHNSRKLDCGGANQTAMLSIWRKQKFAQMIAVDV